MIDYQPPKRKAGRGADRVYRKFQILVELRNHALRQLAVGSTDLGLTTYQIAKLCKVHPTGHFLNILWELYHEGAVKSRTTEHRPNQLKYIWTYSATARLIEPYAACFNLYAYTEEDETHVFPAE